MPPLLDQFLPGTKNPLHETQGKPAPVSLIAAGQSLGVRNWLGRGALVTVASPGPATVQFNHCSPADSPAHSRPALLPRFHRLGGSLEPALGATLPVRGLSRSIVAGQYTQDLPLCQLSRVGRCGARQSGASALSFPHQRSLPDSGRGALRPCPPWDLLSLATLAVFTAVHRPNSLWKELGCRKIFLLTPPRWGTIMIERILVLSIWKA